jgi:hypothetical protein
VHYKNHCRSNVEKNKGSEESPSIEKNKKTKKKKKKNLQGRRRECVLGFFKHTCRS